MHTKKHLKFEALRTLVSNRVQNISDSRMQGKIDHELHDCCLSSLAIMFFQDPSINQFQMRLQKAWHKNNLQTLFDVNTIPKETQIREVLDSIPSTKLEPIFADFFKPLQRGKQLEQFKILNGGYFMPIDATQYFILYLRRFIVPNVSIKIIQTARQPFIIKC